jgi:hypothetical protein
MVYDLTRHAQNSYLEYQLKFRFSVTLIYFIITFDIILHQEI